MYCIHTSRILFGLKKIKLARYVVHACNPSTEAEAEAGGSLA
jgi:hypothetical protein